MRRLADDTRGVTAVEFALALPILLLFVLGLSEMGLAVNEKMRLQSAARSGAQFALAAPTDTAGIIGAVEQASGLVAADIQVAVTTFCGCADGTDVACDSQCSDLSTRRTYVGVSVTETYPLTLSFPGMAQNLTLSGSAILRVE